MASTSPPSNTLTSAPMRPKVTRPTPSRTRRMFYTGLAFLVAFALHDMLCSFQADRFFPQDRRPSAPAQSAATPLDCDGEGSLCTYFNPIAFYDFMIDLGYPLKKGVSTEVPGGWIRFTAKPGFFINRTYPPRDWSYIHLPKAGGTTMEKMANEFPNNEIGKHFNVEMHVGGAYNKRMHDLGRDEYMRQTQIAFNTTTFLTFVRDPISRFCSAAGQMAKQLEHPSYYNNTLAPCYSGNSTDNMKCVLELLTKSEGDDYFDWHFTPMSTRMYRMMLGHNASIAVMPLDSINAFMESLQVKPIHENAADGVKTNYTVDALDSDMIRDVCKVYEVDVHMMRLLEFPVPRCDEHIPVAWGRNSLYNTTKP